MWGLFNAEKLPLHLQWKFETIEGWWEGGQGGMMGRWNRHMGGVVHPYCTTPLGKYLDQNHTCMQKAIVIPCPWRACRAERTGQAAPQPAIPQAFVSLKLLIQDEKRKQQVSYNFFSSWEIHKHFITKVITGTTSDTSPQVMDHDWLAGRIKRSQMFMINAIQCSW